MKDRRLMVLDNSEMFLAASAKNIYNTETLCGFRISQFPIRPRNFRHSALMSSDRERDRAPPRGCVLPLNPTLFKRLRLHSSNTPIDQFNLVGVSFNRNVVWIEDVVCGVLGLHRACWDEDDEDLHTEHVGYRGTSYDGCLAVDGETSDLWGWHADDEWVNPMSDFEYAKRHLGYDSVDPGVFYLSECFSDACVDPNVSHDEYSAHGNCVFFVNTRGNCDAATDSEQARMTFVIWRGLYSFPSSIEFAEQQSINTHLLFSKYKDKYLRRLVDTPMAVWMLRDRPSLGKPLKVWRFSKDRDDCRIVLDAAPWACITDEFQQRIRSVTCGEALVLWALSSAGDAVSVAVITAPDARSPLQACYFSIGLTGVNVRFFNAAMDNYAGVMLIYGCKMAQSADFFPEARYALYSVPIPGVEKK